MADEEKKKVKKLVVEETSAPVAPEEVSGIPVEEKDETLQESILIPKEEKRAEEISEKPEEETPRAAKDSKVSLVWVILLALFIIASFIVGGILIFRAGVEKGKLEAGGTSTATSGPTPTPTASPSAEILREDLKVQVLNGTGKAGVAASAKEYLEGLGYKEVETGNADASDFEETVISIKDSKKNYLEALKRDLSKKYELANAIETSSLNSDFDVIVTIGAFKETAD